MIIVKLLLSLAVLAAVSAVLIHRCLLDTPLPEGLEDPEPLRQMVTTSNAVFYTAVAFWMAGATRSVFEPVKFLARIIRCGNGQVEFPGLETRIELIVREDGSQLPLKIDTPAEHREAMLSAAEAEAAGSAGGTTSRPCLIYLHGGGYVLNDPTTYHAVTGNLSASLGLPVFTPDYRKSPQWTHPAPLDDAMTTLRHVRANARRYGIDPARIALVGDSAGGHLSIAATLRLLSEAGGSPPAALALIYPATQLITSCLPSHLENRLDVFLPETTAGAFRLSYLVGDTADLPVWKASNHSTAALRAEYAERFDLPLLANPCPNNPGDGEGLDWAVARYQFAYEDWLLSPLFAPKDLLARFPPSLLQTCQFDILRDEGRMFYERLRRAGASFAEHRQYASVHGMFGYLRVGHRPAVAAIDDVKAFLTGVLGLGA